MGSIFIWSVYLFLGLPRYFSLSETRNIFIYVVTSPTLIPYNAELNFAGCHVCAFIGSHRLNPDMTADTQLLTKVLEFNCIVVAGGV